MYQIFTRKRLITLTISAICLFIFSIILAFVILPQVINSQIDKNIRLERGTDQWHRFVQLPYNISLNITFFEVTNAENVIKNGEKPNLVEKGPYVFDEIFRRKIISYNENNDTITYVRNTEFYFNESKSGPGLTYDDTVTLINPGYMAILQMIGDVVGPKLLPTAAPVITICMKKMFPDGLFMKDYPIKNLLFEGVKVCDFNYLGCHPFYDICSKFLGISKTIQEVGKKGDKEHYVKFSFFNYKKSPDGVYEIKTGISNIEDVATIVDWNYANSTNFWGKEYNDCNSVVGTDGTMFPPHVSEDTIISVYSTDICRNVEAYYNTTSTYKGIEGYVFKTKPDLFYSKYSTPGQDCYCVNKTLDIFGEKTCFMDGAIDINTCLGAPVLVSYPHFLYSDPKYLENLNGLSPDPEKHELNMLIDKYTGIPLQAHKRVQMSVIIRHLKYFDEQTKNLPPAVLPIIWIDEGIELPDSGIELLNSLLYDTLTLVNILKWLFIGITLLIAIVAGAAVFFRK